MRSHVERYYKKYDPVLRRFLRFKARFVDTDEVMQNVWLDVLVLKDCEIEYPQQFLRMIALREFINWMRDRQKRAHIELTDDNCDSLKPEWDLEIDSEKIVSTLPRRQQQCFRAHLAGWTMGEIAMHLGIAEDTVKQHVSAARQRVKLYDTAQII
jgi:RNA polymerase sigma factor (sigma-70 family)